MDIRIMEYFLAVVREGNISAAADALHISQPVLSRQISDLEKELGVKLFERGSRKITLTEEGMILRKRSEEMMDLMQRTQNEIRVAKESVSGDIHIGAGEAKGFHYISEKAAQLMKQYPDIHIHIVSGDTEDLSDQLENGLIDMAMIYSDFDHSAYDCLPVPYEERFGVLMPKDSPLARKKKISMKDLYGKPVIISRTARLSSDIVGESGLDIVATYNLVYNASLMVEDGIGYAITFDGLVNVSGDSPLTFRPLVPKVTSQAFIIWKKYVIYPAPVRILLDMMSGNELV